MEPVLSTLSAGGDTTTSKQLCCEENPLLKQSISFFKFYLIFSNCMQCVSYQSVSVVSFAI